MPHPLQNVLDHADELAERMSDWEPAPGEVRTAAPLRAIASAVIARGEVEANLAEAVREACDAGHTWSAIAVFLGGSAQAAQQRYGTLTKAQPEHQESCTSEA